MPRKGPAQRRELDSRSAVSLTARLADRQQGHAARQAHRRREDRVRHAEDRRREEWRRAGRHPEACRRQHQAAARGQEPPRRWRQLSGAGRGACAAGQHVAIRWLVDFSRKRREKTMAECLANEVLDAANGLGAAIKRRDDMQKMAESNKAFAHYRW